MDNYKWDYFSISNKEKCNCNILLPTATEREKRNEDVFTSAKRETHDNLIAEHNDYEYETSESTNSICSLQKIETVFNHNLCYLCHFNDILDKFIEYHRRIDVSLKRIKEV